MSNNEDGVKMVRYGAAQIEHLCPQVINAARILAARPKSKVSFVCGKFWMKVKQSVYNIFVYLSVACIDFM